LLQFSDRRVTAPQNSRENGPVQGDVAAALPAMSPRQAMRRMRIAKRKRDTR
jgi:hypothetical protein